MNEEYKKYGAQILVILGASLDQTRRYAEILKTPFPVLADPDRRIYHRYELDKNFIGIQRTASIIIDQNGKIRYLKRLTNPMPWLKENKELLQAIRSS